MNGTKSTMARFALRSLMITAASSATLLAGCGNLVTTAVSTSSTFASSGKLAGKVHGGSQPVTGASIQLFTVGFGNSNSYGPGNTSGLLLATTTTAGDGSFGFSQQTSGTFDGTTNQYVCPTNSADAVLYIKSTGGNTTGNGDPAVSNSAAVFLAPVGLCSLAASQYVNISEVTTAAMVVTLGQYINPSTEMIGTDGIAVTYHAALNAFQTVSTLVSSQTGLANVSVAIGGAAGGLNVAGVTMTATPESAKLNTIADILSSCINQVSATSATNCSTLFNNAVQPSTAGIARSSQPNGTFPAATDTLQAALYMFINPTNGSLAARTNLFNLTPAMGAPYQPTLSALPTDWTIAIAYQTQNTCASNNNAFFSQPSDLSVDANGNLWISNNSTSPSNLVEISNSGVPTSCQTLSAQGLAGGTIDNEGNIWYGDGASNQLFRFTAPGSTQITANNPVYSVRTYTTQGPVLAITADGSDNIYFTALVGGVGQVFKVVAGANISGVNAPIQVAGNVGPNPLHIFPDKAGDLWVTSGAGYVTELSTSTATSATNGYVTTQYTAPSPTIGVVVGPANKIFITSADPGSSLTVLAPQSVGSGYSVLFSTPANTGGLSNPQGIYIDGQQTSWAANNTADSATNLYSLSAVSVSGAEVSASGNTNGGYQKSLLYFNRMRNVVVDQSGNVWVTNDGIATVTEVLGAAVMIYGGYATGLQNGRFMTEA